ncbi:MAG TPA: hypothetical protein VIV09_09005 [Pseudolabrys sp.]
MSTFQIVRIVAVIVAAAVLFWLGQGLHLQLYFAIPAACVVYAVVLVALSLWLKAEPPKSR